MTDCIKSDTEKCLYFNVMIPWFINLYNVRATMKIKHSLTWTMLKSSHLIQGVPVLLEVAMIRRNSRKNKLRYTDNTKKQRNTAYMSPIEQFNESEGLYRVS